MPTLSRILSSAIVLVMSWQERIAVDPKVLVGKPVVKGTRISVELIVELLANGWTHDQLVDSYPSITVDDIRACLAYASDVLHSERVYPPTTR
jgi:uncharacterized protein (DUF433 family)